MFLLYTASQIVNLEMIRKVWGFIGWDERGGEALVRVVKHSGKDSSNEWDSCNSLLCHLIAIMRAVLIADSKGPIENLYIGEVQTPKPESGEILVKV
jgi:hypothetical protein